MKKRPYGFKSLEVIGLILVTVILDFFHLSTLARRRKNHILALKDASNSWVHDVDRIKDMVREFFLNHYCDDMHLSPFPISGGFLVVERKDWDFVCCPITFEEIKDTLFQMGSLKLQVLMVFMLFSISLNGRF